MASVAFGESRRYLGNRLYRRWWRGVEVRERPVCSSISARITLIEVVEAHRTALHIVVVQSGL
jgi:hypothetical protein